MTLLSEPLMPDDQFGDIDRHFGRLIARLSRREDPGLVAAASLASRATGSGDVCVDLAQFAGHAVPGCSITAPALGEWIASLRNSPAVGRPGEFRPLVLDESGRLYLYRYWDYEQRLAQNLLARAAGADGVDGVDGELLRAGLVRFFPDSRDIEQKFAAAIAVLRRFCVISGGPGTGKTFTVVKILALLAEQAQGRQLAVGLAAPTGKAAARVQETIRLALARLDLDAAARACIPDEAYTLHRLLGARPGSVYYRHDRDNPLPLDVLVVDEASMADLALMAKLVEALPPHARLILLGDRDQLASVEAGAVLGDICAGSGFSAEFAARLAAATGVSAREISSGVDLRLPLADSVALLNRSYRFGADSGIGKLAKLVNHGEGEAALGLLGSGAHDDIAWRPVAADGLKASLTTGILDRLTPYLDGVRGSGAPQEIFARFNAFRAICAHRSGPMGAATVNRIIEAGLEDKNLISTRQPWYAGRPVMVTRNDYNLQLFNGDVGITLPDADAADRLKVFFPGGDGGMRKFAPARLPEHETVYAMTIHKAQGSEFGQVLMILPAELSRIMSRELLYTGITRARDRVEIWGSDGIFVQAVRRRVVRASALRHRLWQGQQIPPQQ
jgi:exodeoxyribonuclease V alpha subunit